MINIAKKIAQKSHDEIANCTTRTARAPHGLGKVARRGKRRLNRSARRKAGKIAFSDYEEV